MSRNCLAHKVAVNSDSQQFRRGTNDAGDISTTLDFSLSKALDESKFFEKQSDLTLGKQLCHGEHPG